MPSVTLNLSESTRTAAERRAAQNGFSSVEDYIAGLVEQDAAVGEQLEALLSHRAAQPDAGQMTAADFDAIRQRVRAASHRRVG